jgi:lipopolysaccharide export LptBFGC system permease protein LptF
MESLGTFFAILYVTCIIAVIIYVLRLLSRFVRAHERVAKSIEIIANKMKDETEP